MVSIIVAVHNQIGHNRLFLDGIRQYTTGPYEVIVVDNHSTDGSAEFFEGEGCRVIRHDRNRCYPESMNAGSRIAKGDWLCHINNDVYVAPNWNRRLVEAMERHRLDAASPLGLEMMPSPRLTDWMQRRWAAIGQGRLSSGKGVDQLRAMLQAMYGNWDRYCEEVHQAFSELVFDGIVGSCVMMRKAVYDALGGLDERIQAADWDLYYTLRQREREIGDMKRVMVLGTTFLHHFIRATVKSQREPFACTHERWSIDQKWSRAQQISLWCKPDEFVSGSVLNRLSRHVVRPLKKLFLEVDRLTAFRRGWTDPEHIVDEYRRQFARVRATASH